MEKNENIKSLVNYELAEDSCKIIGSYSKELPLHCSEENSSRNVVRRSKL